MMLTNAVPQTTALLLNSDQVDLLKGILLGVLPRLGGDAQLLLDKLDASLEASEAQYPQTYTWTFGQDTSVLRAIPPGPNRAARRAKSANKPKTKRRSS